MTSNAHPINMLYSRRVDGLEISRPSNGRAIRLADLWEEIADTFSGIFMSAWRQSSNEGAGDPALAGLDQQLRRDIGIER